MHDVPCTVQFVRAISPSTSYAPAAVAVAKNYGWKRVCTLAFQSPDYRATAVAWTNLFVDNFINARNIYVDEQGFRRSGSLSATLSKIEADRLRVVIVFAQPEYVKLVALRADTMGYVSSGWAWVSDGVIGKINFKGDTPDVRAVQLLCFLVPMRAGSSRRCLRVLLCGCSARACAALASERRAPSVAVMHRRQSQQDARSTGGCTSRRSIPRRPASASSRPMCAS